MPSSEKLLAVEVKQVHYTVLPKQQKLGDAAESVLTFSGTEALALEKYGGTDQLTYLCGKEVAYGTPGATRPDVVRLMR